MTTHNSAHAERRVVVTGAGSYIGRAVVRDLARLEGLTVTALGSLRWTADAPDGVEARACDLSADLDPMVMGAMDNADAIIHLAWARGGNASVIDAGNDAMLAHMTRGRGLARVTFTSTVAAGPKSPSIYGRGKQRVADRVTAAGGRVLVLGGVVDEPPGSSHAELCRTVADSRLALRFPPPTPRLHLTSLDAVVTAIRACTREEIAPGAHPIFDAEPTSINAYMETLEARSPRMRVPVPVWAPAVLTAARALNPTPVGPVLDRLASFIGRDVAWLSTLGRDT